MLRTVFVLRRLKCSHRNGFIVRLSRIEFRRLLFPLPRSAVMRANQCINRLSEKKHCSSEDSHEARAHFARKTRNKNCEDFDYGPCGASASTAGVTASLLAVAALVALLMDKL